MHIHTSLKKESRWFQMEHSVCEIIIKLKTGTVYQAYVVHKLCVT